MAKKFIKLRYLISQNNLGPRPPKTVTGYAFETPGWAQFHACVRFDKRDTWFEKGWIVDHYESGFTVSQIEIKTRSQAPQALARFLNGKGLEKVSAVIGPYIKT